MCIKQRFFQNFFLPVDHDTYEKIHAKINSKDNSEEERLCFRLYVNFLFSKF